MVSLSPVSRLPPPYPSSLLPLFSQSLLSAAVPSTLELFNLPRAVLPSSSSYFFGIHAPTAALAGATATVVDQRPALPRVVNLIASNHCRSGNTCATAAPGPYLWKHVHHNHNGGAGLSTTCAQTAAFEANNPPYRTSAYRSRSLQVRWDEPTACKSCSGRLPLGSAPGSAAADGVRASRANQP